MGKITKILKATDVGDMGIGAMIVFIAMVLVAGIAASVLIQTANRLEIQAMTTGQETTGEVSTGLHVVSIDGNKSGNGLQRIGITVQSRSGSKDIDLSQTYVEISDTTTKCILLYNSNEFNLKATIGGDLYKAAFFNACNATRFGVVVLEDADSSLSAATPVLTRGDKVLLTIDAVACFTGNGIDPRDDVFGLVQPEQGAPAVFSFTAPSSIAGDSLFTLY
jgi:flagellin FlaB